MEKGDQYRVVLVTAPNMEAARDLAKATLESGLIACANILPQVESHFTWEGNVEAENEVLIIFKTTADRLEDFEAAVRRQHPYDTPEILAMPIESGLKEYLSWVTDSTR